MKSCDDITLQLLVEKSIVAPKVIDSLQNSLESGHSLIDGLIVAGHTSNAQILELLADEFRLPSGGSVTKLDSRQIDRDHIDRKSVLEMGILLFDPEVIVCQGRNT